jgi:hypothetical protein
VKVSATGGGTAWAKTVSGPVRITGGPLTRLEAQTVSGNVDLDVRPEGGNIHVERT